MSTPIVEAEVADYLKKHPEFFSKHGDLLTQLNIPHQSGEAVSLVEKQLQVLRQTNKDLKARFNQLLEVARQNEQHFENTKQLVVELFDFQLRNGDIEELFEIFELRFPTTLAASEFQLVLLDQNLGHSEAATLTKLKAIESKELKTAIPKFYEMERSFCGALTKAEKAFLFGEQAELIASCAVIPVKHKHLEGILAIGNFNESHFHKGMGTMFLDHIGAVIARIVNDLLSKSEQQSIAV